MRNRTELLAIALAVVVSSCCSSKRVTSDGSTMDSVRHERREFSADSVSRRATSERRVETVTDAEIVTEVVTYDTSRTDSLGRSPVKERRRTVARIHNSATETDTTTMQTDSTSVHIVESESDSIANTEQHTTEEKEAQRFPTPLLLFFCGLGICVVLLRFWR